MSENNGFLGRNDLLAKCARRYVRVPLPDGSSVRIQSLSEKELADYEAAVIATPKSRRSEKMIDVHRDRLLDARRRLIAICAVDGDGRRLFTDGDLDAIGELDAAVTNCIADACRAHIGADQDYFDDLVKNSEEIHVVDSRITLPPA